MATGGGVDSGILLEQYTCDSCGELAHREVPDGYKQIYITNTCSVCRAKQFLASPWTRATINKSFYAGPLARSFIDLTKDIT